jgi:diaminopimelate epimerase
LKRRKEDRQKSRIGFEEKRGTREKRRKPMKFTKMQGIGNDYVYVNCLQETIENPSELAKKISDRHYGVGSDGLIMINPSDKADFEMEMYNADGSRGEMCGNGIRCVAKYVYDYGLTDKTSISVETLAGIKYLDLTVEDGKVVLVKVDMGKPMLRPEEVPVVSEKEEVIDEPITVDGQEYRMTCVSMGNPHAVVFIDQDVKEFPLETVGVKFENHERFPKRVNTEFVNVLDRHTAQMRVWERGSGETLACGTGACAVAVACALNGLTEDEVTVKLLGGDLQIKWDREKNTVYMTGPAEVVFDGEWK